jgi:hypothetical protein
MVNAWMAHVKKTRAAHPGKSLKEVLKKASVTYKKKKGTGTKKGTKKRGGTKRRRRKGSKSKAHRRR